MTDPREPLPASEPASTLRQRLALLAVCLACAAMPLTFTGGAVALPAIARSLVGTPVELNWVTSAFMLAFGGSLMAAGTLADRYGRKRVFLGGLALFLLMSGALAGAGSVLAIDVLRAAQGVGSAAVLSSGGAALAQEFAGAARLRAFSFIGTSFGAGLALGPLASGALIALGGWRMVFVLAALIAAVALAIGVRVLHESRDPHAGSLDVRGAGSFTAALGVFTFGLIQAPQAGGASPLVVGALALAVGLGIVFVVVERRAALPMLDLTLFRYPRFVGVQLLAAAPAYAFVVLLVLLPIRLVGIEGLDEVAAGWTMAALSAPLLVLPMAAGRLARRVAPARLCGAGLLVCAAGQAWLSHAVAHHGGVIAPLLAIGAGISLPWGLMDGMAVSVVPKERAGMATGIFGTTRVAGEGIALAVVGAVSAALVAGRLAVALGGDVPRSALAAAAQRLVTGDLAAAAALLPGASSSSLVRAADQAFATLLLGLAGVPVLTAIAVFACLSAPRSSAAPATARPSRAARHRSLPPARTRPRR